MASTNRTKTVFLDLLEVPVGDREAFLAEACVGDGELRGRVERLLAAHEHAEDALAVDLTLLP